MPYVRLQQNRETEDMPLVMKFHSLDMWKGKDVNVSKYTMYEKT